MRNVTLAFLVALVVVLTVPSALAAASPWTLRRLPPKQLEGGSDSAGLNGVSCPSDSLCVAVGGLDTVAFSQSPSGGADRWHAVYPTYDEPKQSCLEKGESVSFCSSPRGSLNAVSCAGENLCVAVGYEGSVFVSTDPTGGAGAWSVSDVDTGGGATHLTGVSCPSPSLCVAVSGGSNNSNGGKALTTTEPILGDWQAIQINSSPDFRGVSCGTPSLCVAVARGGRIFVSTDPTGGVSAWQPAGTPGGPGDLEGVSCVSTLLCAAGNMTGSVLTSTAPNAGGSSWSVANAGGSVQITGVSCPTADACVAVDNNGDVLTSDDPTGGPGSWTFENLIPFEAAGPETGPVVANALFGASCASTSLCVLVGTESRIFTATDPFASPARPPLSVTPKRTRLRPRTHLVFAENFLKLTRTRNSRVRAHFRFYSRDDALGFVCKRDRDRWRKCRSPLRYWVRVGHHILRVRAIGQTGLRGAVSSLHFAVRRLQRRTRAAREDSQNMPHAQSFVNSIGPLGLRLLTSRANSAIAHRIGGN